MIRDDNMSTSLPLSVSSASGPSAGTFDLTVVMRKIERAGSCNTWTKVMNCMGSGLDGYMITIEDSGI